MNKLVIEGKAYIRNSNRCPIYVIQEGLSNTKSLEALISLELKKVLPTILTQEENWHHDTLDAFKAAGYLHPTVIPGPYYGGKKEDIEPFAKKVKVTIEYE